MSYDYDYFTNNNGDIIYDENSSNVTISSTTDNLISLDVDDPDYTVEERGYDVIITTKQGVV